MIPLIADSLALISQALSSQLALNSHGHLVMYLKLVAQALISHSLILVVAQALTSHALILMMMTGLTCWL